MLPFQFQAGIFWTVSQPSDGYLSNANFAGYTGDTGISIGVGDSSLNQECVATGSDQQAFAPFNRSSRATFTDRVVVAGRGPDLSLSQDYLTIDASDRCGITFGVNGTASYRVHYLVFAGGTLNTAIGSLTLPDDGSDATVTGLPFDPSADPHLLIVLSADGTDDNGDGHLSLGFAASIFQQAVSEWKINYNARGGSAAGSGNLVQLSFWLAFLSAYTSDGFTLSQDNRGSTTDLLYLLLSDANGAFTVGQEDWPSAPASVTDPGFQPEAVFFHDLINGEEDTGGQITVGAAAAYPPAATPVTAATLAGVANVDDQRRWTAQGTDTGDVLLDYLGNPGTESGNVSFSGFTGTGFDIDGTASGVAAQIRYAAILLSAASGLCESGQIIRYR